MSHAQDCNHTYQGRSFKSEVVARTPRIRVVRPSGYSHRFGESKAPTNLWIWKGVRNGESRNIQTKKACSYDPQNATDSALNMCPRRVCIFKFQSRSNMSCTVRRSMLHLRIEPGDHNLARWTFHCLDLLSQLTEVAKKP